MMASNAENYIFRVAGHNMTLIALDGVDVDPIMVTDINMHIGERAGSHTRSLLLLPFH